MPSSVARSTVCSKRLETKQEGQTQSRRVSFPLMPTDFEPYPAPLDGLNALDLDESNFLETIDYRRLGITEADIPALIRIATDRRFDTAMLPATWAPVHACRALGELQAAAATGTLLEMLNRADDEDWILEEVPRALGAIGNVAAVSEYLADRKRPLWSRIGASTAIGHIGKAHPDRRSDCVAAVSGQLQLYKHQDTQFNALMISDLIDLQAVESAPIIEEAFRARRVDVSIPGDWEDVQVELGILPTRLTPAPFYGRKLPQLDSPAAPAPTSRDRNAEKRRRKLAKQSKRRNRRRK